MLSPNAYSKSKLGTGVHGERFLLERWKFAHLLFLDKGINVCNQKFKKKM